MDALQLNRSVRRFARRLMRPYAAGRARTVMASPSRITSAAGQALFESLYASTTPDEGKWIQRIEELRLELEQSEDVIEIVDYGAGAQTDHRTEEEMSGGTVVTRHIGPVCRGASKPRFWALLLMKLIRNCRPQRAVEMGTCFGISSAYQAAAMAMNGAGQLTTLEGAPALAERARAHFERLGLQQVRVVAGRFKDTLPDVLEVCSPVDYVFVDGHHEEQATKEYYKMLLPHMADESLLVFDDISWNAGMKRAWDAIRGDGIPGAVIDLKRIGIVVIDRAAAGTTTFRIPIA